MFSTFLIGNIIGVFSSDYSHGTSSRFSMGDRVATGDRSAIRTDESNSIPFARHAAQRPADTRGVIFWAYKEKKTPLNLVSSLYSCASFLVEIKLTTYYCSLIDGKWQYRNQCQKQEHTPTTEYASPPSSPLPPLYPRSPDPPSS